MSALVADMNAAMERHRQGIAHSRSGTASSSISTPGAACSRSASGHWSATGDEAGEIESLICRQVEGGSSCTGQDLGRSHG